MNTLARILVVDDEPHFRRATGRLLERNGYAVEQAANVNEALERLSHQVFDLLIADIHMPDSEGLALLHVQDVVPVLVVTGAPSVETAVEALRGSAVDYLAKPLAPEAFLIRVADGVARTRALRTLRSAELRLREQLELVASLQTSLQVAGGLLEFREQDASDATTELPASIIDKLSPREQEVLSAFRELPRPSKVAGHLHISPHTVKNHLRSIYRKLGVNSQAELLAHIGQADRKHG
jgi:DNA-binding NarL/FixJ family response regulator